MSINRRGRCSVDLETPIEAAALRSAAAEAERSPFPQIAVLVDALTYDLAR